MSQQDPRQNHSVASVASVALLINGARGRMGSAIARLARDDARFRIAALRDVDDRADRAAEPAAPAENAIDVIVDFSSDAGTREAIALALRQRAALLVGTTGLSSETLAMLDRAAESVAMLISANTSLGVAVLAHVAAEAARLLGGEFDIDIVEAHHATKRDAPSGTALRLAAALRERGGATLPDERLHAIRAGDIIGEHAIHFSGPGERLILTHAATSRELFARGALRAAAFLAHKPPGRYSIEQTLNR